MKRRRLLRSMGKALYPKCNKIVSTKTFCPAGFYHARQVREFSTTIYDSAV
jgi:hypothetical protein